MSEQSPTMLESLVLAWTRKYPAGTGHLDSDLISFGEMVLAEKKRRDDLQRAREICLEHGGHFFSFLTAAGLGGEIRYENGKTTIIGWRGCDLKCDHCDAWLTVRYEEDEK